MDSQTPQKKLKSSVDEDNNKKRKTMEPEVSGVKQFKDHERYCIGASLNSTKWLLAGKFENFLVKTRYNEEYQSLLKTMNKQDAIWSMWCKVSNINRYLDSKFLVEVPDVARPANLNLLKVSKTRTKTDRKDPPGDKL